jgi:hypothetical protein
VKISRTFAFGLVLCCYAPARAAQVMDLVPRSPAWVMLPTDAVVAGYDTLWAISDLHGHLAELQELLVAAKLAVPSGRGTRVVWNPVQRRQLLIAVGDYLDGGADSVGVVLLLQELQAQAASIGSRVVVLLGNHEAAFLSDPEARATKELRSSARRSGVGTPRQLYDGQFGAYLRELPVAAFVGSWLFAHAGNIRAKPAEEPLRRYFLELAAVLATRDRRAYLQLLESRSLISGHRWWADERRLAQMKRRLDVLGLNGLIIGHDPDALGARGTIAMNRGGWLIKLDTGMKSSRSRGKLLRCAVSDIVHAGGFSMARDSRPGCQAVASDGSIEELRVN